MIDEEKQLDNTQSSANNATEGSQDMEIEMGSTPIDLKAAEISSDVLGVAEIPLTEESVGEVAAESLHEEPATVEAAPQETLASEALYIELANKEAEIESLKTQLQEITNQKIRIAADFDNFRKRKLKEQEELAQSSKCSTLQELLPVVDNFERAKAQIKPQTDGEKTIHKSYQGVYRQLVESLKRLGVSAMNCKDEPFDPNYHEAVMREQTDQYPEGTVIEELMRGYMLADRVLRHAMVKVAAAPDPVESSAESDESNESIES